MARPIVEQAFVPFSIPLEGKVSAPYLDDLGLVTVGMGNLIDPIELGDDLSWVHADDGSPVSNQEYRSAWYAVKNSGLAGIGGGSPKFAALTNIRLTDEGISELVQKKVRSFEDNLLQHFPNYPLWPADAQLGGLSMEWAMGDKWNTYPKFKAAANQLYPDFQTMAEECFMHGAGLDARNAANKQLFTNAAQVVSEGLNFDSLLYPVPGLIGNPIATGVATAGNIIRHPMFTAFCAVAIGGALWYATDIYTRNTSMKDAGKYMIKGGKQAVDVATGYVDEAYAFLTK